MSPTKKLNVCIILLVIISRGLCHETVCSKYYYEKRVLEKMIRQEIKVEQMETEIKNTLKSISSFIADIEQKLYTMAADIELKMNTKVSEMELLMNTKTSEMDSEIKESLNEVSTIADNMKTTMNLQTLSDNVTVPRIAFNSYNLKDLTAAATTGATFIFPDVQFNEGDGYDSNTGVFTAPVNGVYYFTVNMCNANTYFLYFGINVDGSTVAASTQSDHGSTSCNSLSTITVLQTGNKVSVRSTSGASNRRTTSSVSTYRPLFNGVLLHK